MRRCLLLVVPFAVIACGKIAPDPAARTALPTAMSSNPSTDTSVGGSAGSRYDDNNDAAILALANDPSMTAADYVAKCHFTEAQAEALVSHRTFHSMSEMSELPLFDATFWKAAYDCSESLRLSGLDASIGCSPAPSRPAVIIELVVDESGSMLGEKWDALRDSLLATFVDMNARQDAQVLVGALAFDDRIVGSVRPSALTSPGQLDQLRTLIDRQDPSDGGTSIESALSAAYATLDGLAATGDAPAGARRVVVLLTDGAPTGGESEQLQVLDLVENERANGAELFAVGIGEFPSDDPYTYDPKFISEVAQKGGGAPASCDGTLTDPSNLCYFQITPGTGPTTTKLSLLKALGAIRTSTTCQ